MTTEPFLRARARARGVTTPFLQPIIIVGRYGPRCTFRPVSLNGIQLRSITL